MRLPEFVRPVSSVNLFTRLCLIEIPSSTPRARSNFSPAITVRSALVATKVPSRKTFIAPARKGKSEEFTTFEVRNAAAWRFGTVRYSGVALRLADVIGTFCGELSLGTLELTAILKEALVAPDSMVAEARSAETSKGESC